ncbi:hypothetical protein BC628DRAFT_1341245 [Trametes gibbosa]|nr:hypothetical protein BC628DRAFT_1341245 [Trametes gibbosa]
MEQKAVAATSSRLMVSPAHWQITWTLANAIASVYAGDYTTRVEKLSHAVDTSPPKSVNATLMANHMPMRRKGSNGKCTCHSATLVMMSTRNLTFTDIYELKRTLTGMMTPWAEAGAAGFYARPDTEIAATTILTSLMFMRVCNL